MVIKVLCSSMCLCIVVLVLSFRVGAIYSTTHVIDLGGSIVEISMFCVHTCADLLLYQFEIINESYCFSLPYDCK